MASSIPLHSFIANSVEPSVWQIVALSTEGKLFRASGGTFNKWFARSGLRRPRWRQIPPIQDRTASPFTGIPTI
jgi:hypothetical protein